MGGYNILQPAGVHSAHGKRDVSKSVSNSLSKIYTLEPLEGSDRTETFAASHFDQTVDVSVPGDKESNTKTLHKYVSVDFILTNKTNFLK